MGLPLPAGAVNISVTRPSPTLTVSGDGGAVAGASAYGRFP